MEIQIQYNGKDKKVSIPEDTLNKFPQLSLDVDQLNTLTNELIANGSEVPPVASLETFNKDLSKMIKKLYEGAVQAFKQNKLEESIRQFSIGIEMLSRRHKFEAFQGTLQELCMFLMSRTDANLKAKHYIEAFNDVDMLLSLQLSTPDNFLRRGVANYFIGNYEAARADYQRGLALAPNNQRLQDELEACLDKILEENGDYL